MINGTATPWVDAIRELWDDPEQRAP